MRVSSARVLLIIAVFAPSVAWSHQPVMDMAPRWQGGFGVQLRHEHRESDRILEGTRRQHDPQGREKRVDITWLEGIYTYRRELRFTLKVPYVDQQRDSMVGGAPVRQTGRGIGDVIAAVPLRKYWNLQKSTVNIGLTPQLRVPTGSTSDSYPVGDGSWDFGLSASVSAENALWYSLLDAFWWKNTPGRRGIDAGDLLGIDGNAGIHFYHDNATNTGGFALLDLELRHEARGRDTGGTTGGSRVTLGPILIGYWNNIMLRGEAKFPVYERVFGTQFSRGILFNVGAGVTF